MTYSRLPKITLAKIFANSKLIYFYFTSLQTIYWKKMKLYSHTIMYIKHFSSPSLNSEKNKHLKDETINKENKSFRRINQIQFIF